MLNLSAITAEVSFILTVAQRFPCPTAVSSRDHIFKRMTDSDDVIHCHVNNEHFWFGSSIMLFLK